LGDIGHGLDPPITVIASAIQPGVPAIALMDNTRKPPLDRLDEEVGTKTGPLCEVAELVSENTCELRQSKPCGERQADREIEIAKEESAPAVNGRGRVYLQICVDPGGARRPKSIAQTVDELEKYGFIVRQQSDRSGGTRGPDQYRF
jgi:hypothetical protein